MSPEWYEWLRKNMPPHMFEEFEAERIHSAKWRDDEIHRLQSALAAERKRREEAEADNSRLREALEDLQRSEAAYRMAHDAEGDGSLVAGRCWDLMRRAGDIARAALNHKSKD